MPYSVRFILSLLCLAALAGCSRGKTFVIPEMPTARQQYEIAFATYRKAETSVPNTKTRTLLLDESKAAFREVEYQFPADDMYTPRAGLMVARCEFTRRNWRQAATEYRRALARYPGNSEVRSNGLYELGLALDNDKRFRESKEVFRQYLQEFGNTQDPEIKRHVEIARQRYMEIHTE